MPAESTDVPFPEGGWNAVDAVSRIPPSDAIWLENMVVRPYGLELRPFPTLLASGLDGPVDSLFEWAAPGGAPRLIAATASSMWNVTSGTAVQMASGLSGGGWSGTLLVNNGSAFLLVCNGVAAPLVSDGSVFRVAPLQAASDISDSFDPTQISMCCTHGRRLIMAEKSVPRLWYLDLDAIAGPVWPFPVSSLMQKGGSITGLISTAADGASRPHDKLAIATTNGEVIVFAGFSPARSETWKHLGTWTVPLPVAGKRCFVDLGNDIGLLTERGLLALSGIVAKRESRELAGSLTEKIWNAYGSLLPLSGGWQAVHLPRERITMINAPQTLSVSWDSDDATWDEIDLSFDMTDTSIVRSKQLVLSADKDAWSMFSGIDATCWGRFKEDAYFGNAAGEVWAYAGATHGSTAIEGVMLGGYLPSDNLQQPVRLRPHYRSFSNYVPAMRSIADYAWDGLSRPPFAAQAVGDGLGLWGEPWLPLKPWVAPQLRRWPWLGSAARGHAMAVGMAVRTKGPFVYMGAKMLGNAGGLP